MIFPIFPVLLPRDKEGTIFEDGPFDHAREERRRRREQDQIIRERLNREDQESHRRWQDDQYPQREER